MDKLRIITLWHFNSPFHAIIDEKGTTIVRLTNKNYKLAKKLKEFLLKNPALYRNQKDLEFIP